MIPTLYLETPIFPQTSNPQIPGFVTNRHMPPVNLSRSPVKAGCAESPHDAQGLMGGLCPRVEQTSHLSRAFPAVPCALCAWQAPHQIMTLETCGRRWPGLQSRTRASSHAGHRRRLSHLQWPPAGLSPPQGRPGALGAHFGHLSGAVAAADAHAAPTRAEAVRQCSP